MELNECRQLNWKTCFKKILAPHLLNPPDDEKQNNENDYLPNYLNTENDNLNAYMSPKDRQILERTHKDTLQSTKESVQTGVNLQLLVDGFSCNQDSVYSDDKINGSEVPFETEKEITNVITAHAEELAKTFKSFRVTKNNKHFNKAESTRSPPNWNLAIKEVLSPERQSESSINTLLSESSNPETLYNRWTFHRLSREDNQWSERMEEVEEKTCRENSKKKRHYTEDEKKVLEILRSARCFKQKKKPHINIFDGAGVNCFKDNRI